ncbi:MAG: hypothetical protein QOJ27_124, partial [Sphingomonadales bacterium]|nr:hypothetical protein [Sphingomonadales bacterium]
MNERVRRARAKGESGVEARRSPLELRWAIFLLSITAACSVAPPTEKSGPRPLTQAQAADCGMNFVVRRLIPRPGSGESRVKSGASIPACALPSAVEIAAACRGPEGVPIPGTRDPDGADAPQYAFPDYSVQNPVCRDADSGRSAADCMFDLDGRQSGRERITARLHHRFHDLSNAIAHDYLSTGWEVDSVCRSGR